MKERLLIKLNLEIFQPDEIKKWIRLKHILDDTLSRIAESEGYHVPD
jgi:hypothetical protein